MGGLEKPIYRGNCLKKGAWTVCRIKRGLDERKGVVVFEGWGVDTLMHTMSTFYGSSPNVTSIFTEIVRKPKFSDDFRGNRSEIRLNLLSFRSEFFRRCLRRNAIL